jgi:hypothetical protein
VSAKDDVFRKDVFVLSAVVVFVIEIKGCQQVSAHAIFLAVFATRRATSAINRRVRTTALAGKDFQAACKGFYLACCIACFTQVVNVARQVIIVQ